MDAAKIACLPLSPFLPTFELTLSDEVVGTNEGGEDFAMLYLLGGEGSRGKAAAVPLLMPLSEHSALWLDGSCLGR
jgi:hypothetical protein